MAITPRKFFISLTNSIGQSYRWVRGNLTTQGTPHQIENAPDGIFDTSIGFGRNLKYLGVFRGFSTPLKFVTEARKIINNLFFSLGVEAICNLVILKRDNDWIHRDLFICELDFSKFVYENDTTTVNLMEGGISKYIKANEGIDYEIPIDGRPVRAIYMPGIDFTASIHYAVYEAGLSDGAHTVGVAYANQEGTLIGFVTGSSPLENEATFDLGTNDDKWLLKCVQGSAINVVISGKMSFDITFVAQFVKISFWKQNGTEYIIYHQIPEDGLGPALVGRYEFNVNLTIPMSVGDKLFIRTLKSQSTIPNAKIIYHDTDLTFTIKTIFPPSTISALPWSYVYKQLISKISSGKYSGSSALLDSRQDLMITCGDALRGLPGSVIKSNLNNCFKSAYSILNVGIGIENQVAVLEKLEYFFDNTYMIYDVGEVSNLSVSFAEDLVYNSIKVGGENQTYDDLNGKDEPNTTHAYSTPGTRVVKEWDLISPWRIDSYGDEFARVNRAGKKTTDSSSDNDICIIQTEEVAFETFTAVASFSNAFQFIIYGFPVLNAGVKLKVTGTTLNDKTFTIVTVTQVTSLGDYTSLTTLESTAAEGNIDVTVTLYKLKPMQTYDSISGVLNPAGIFNVGLSPKRMLYEHGNYLHSILDHMDGLKVKYQTSDKNAEMRSALPGKPEVIEKSDVNIGTLPAKLFLPYYFTFTTQVPINLVELMATNSRGYFAFTWKGNRYKIFAMEIGIKPSDNDTQEWKGLSCPDNVMSKLI